MSFYLRPAYYTAINMKLLFLKKTQFEQTYNQNLCFSAAYRIYDYLLERMKNTPMQGRAHATTLKKWGCEASPSVLAPCPATAVARADGSQSSRGCWLHPGGGTRLPNPARTEERSN